MAVGCWLSVQAAKRLSALSIAKIGITIAIQQIAGTDEGI